LSDSLNIILGSKIDQSSQAVKNIEEQIKQMSGKIKEAISVKLQIDAKQLEVLTKEIEKTQEKIRTKTTVKGSQFINQEVEHQAFNEISTRIRDIRKNVDELAKVDITTNKSGQMTSATLTYYNKELGKTVTETMGWSEAQKIVNGEMVKFKTFETQGFKYTDNMAKARQETEKFNQSLKNLELFKQKMLGGEGFLGEIDIFASKQKGRYDENALAKIRADIQALTIDTPDLNNKMKQLDIQFGSLKKNASEAGGILTRAFENAFKFLRFYLVGGMLVGFVNSIRNGIKEVIALDTALTELNKVADLTSSQLQTFTERAYRAGVEIGRTGIEVINATTEFKRAGYELEEAFNLSQQALLLTNIGDGITDVKEASSSLIAVLKGFKMEAEDTSHVVDALNEVSNNYAVDTNNLTEILKRTSGTLGQTGTSFEELLGLATGGFESLRNAEMVASGINMISQRLRGMSEDGEAVEDLIPKIQEAFDKYTNGAVSIIDKQNGGLHSTFEILQQLSTVYDTLGDEAKAYLNEAIAGNRQNKVLVAIMENWDNVEDSIKSATNSLGSAERENEKYLNSINGKISKLNSNIQLFWQNFIDSDNIKIFIDGLTSIVKTMDALVNNSFSQFVIQTGVLSSTIILASKAMHALGASALGNIAKITAMNIATAGLTATLKAYTVAFFASPLGAVVAVSAGILTIIKAVDLFTVSLEEQREIVQTLSNELNQLQSEYNQLLHNENRTTEQEKYLKILEQELKDKKELLEIETKRAIQQEYFTPSNSKYKSDFGIDDSGSSTIKKQIEDYKRLQEQLSNAVNTTEYNEINGKILTIKTSLEESYKSIQNYINKVDEVPPELQSLANSIYNVIIATDEQSNSTNKVIDVVDTYKQSYEELNKTFETSTSKLIDYNDMIKELEDNHKLSVENVNKIFKDYPQLLAYLGSEKELREQLIKLKDEEAKKQRETYIQMIQDSEEFYNLRIKGNTDLTNEIKDKYDIDLKNFKTLAEAKEKIESTLLKSLSQKWGVYVDAQKGYLTTEYNELMRVNPQMAKEIYGDVVEYLQSGNKFNDVVGKFVESDFSALNLSKTSKDSSKTDYEKPYEEQYQIISKLNYELDRQNEILSQKEDLDKIPILLERNKLLDQQKKNLHDINEARRDELKNLKPTSDRYQELVEKIQDTSLEWWKLDTAQKSNLDTIKKINEEQQKVLEEQSKRLKEITDKKLEAVKSTEEKIVQVLKKSIQEQMDAEEKRHNKVIDDLNKEKEKYQEAYDLIIGNIDRDESTHDYETNLKKLNDEKISLEKQINAWSMDNSAEARATTIELQQQLANKIQEIEELKHDRSIELRKDALKEQLDIDIEEVDSKVESENDMYKAHKESLEEQLKDSKLYAEAQRLLMEGNFEKISTMLTNYENQWGQGMTIMGDSVKDNLIANLKTALSLVSELSSVSGGSNLTEALNSYAETGNNPFGMTVTDFAIYKQNKYDYEHGIRMEEAAKENAELRKKYNIKSDMFSYDQIKGYYKNGSSAITENQLALLHGTPSNPEWVLNTKQISALMDKTMTNFLTNIRIPQANIPKLNAATAGNIEFKINNLISVDHIDNNTNTTRIAEDVVNKMYNIINTRGKS
jgi:TP901 family phage tail tape measure protein